MATAAQIQANRANAARSTGPTSEAGKQKSSQNRLAHGFRSTHVLLPGEDAAEYDELQEQYRAEFLPQDLNEERFVREMIDAEWRLRRVRQIEQRIMETYVRKFAADDANFDPVAVQALAFDDALPQTSLAACLRYGNQYQRQYDRAWQALTSNRRRAARQAPKPTPVNILPFEPKVAAAAPPHSPEISCNLTGRPSS